MAEGCETRGQTSNCILNLVIGDGSTTVAGRGGPSQCYLTITRSSGYIGRGTRRSGRCSSIKFIGTDAGSGGRAGIAALIQTKNR